jgi:hypothetical protein
MSDIIRTGLPSRQAPYSANSQAGRLYLPHPVEIWRHIKKHNGTKPSIKVFFLCDWTGQRATSKVSSAKLLATSFGDLKM